MVGFDCPHCGHPAPLSCESPEALECPSCRGRSPLPAPIRDALRHAAASLASIDARLRQIERSDELAFAHARSLVLGCLFLGVVPWGVVEALAAAVAIDRLNRGRGTWVEALGPFVGFAVVLSAFLLVLLVLRRFRRRFEADFAATPSADAGGAPACRVCGADLPTPTLSNRAVSRCIYCRSDSIVAPAVVRRVSEERAKGVDGRAAVVARHGRARSNVSGSVALVLVLSVPFIGMGAHLGWNRHVGPALESLLTDEAPALHHRYVLVEAGFEDCMRRIDDEGRVLDRVRGTWSSPRPELLRMSFAPTSVTMRSLIDGCGSGAYGTPLRVYGTASENYVVLKDLQGKVRRIPLECACGYFPGIEVVP